MSFSYLLENYENTWKPLFTEQASLLHDIDVKLAEDAKSETIFPSQEKIFNAYIHSPLDKIKVVILGQDPYHGEGEAEGLSFSVPEGIKIPPSLRNIFKELKSDLGVEPPSVGSLVQWADEGVMLLNAMLTVRKDCAASHSKFGWEAFTDATIRYISDHTEKVVFILWGKFAQKKEKLIDTERHFVLKSAHPSPLGARHGFWDSKPFSQTNKILTEQGIEPINWTL